MIKKCGKNFETLCNKAEGHKGLCGFGAEWGDLAEHLVNDLFAANPAAIEALTEMVKASLATFCTNRRVV